MEDLFKWFADKEAESKELDNRMQTDMSLFHLDKYVMRDTEGRRISDIVNVTLNAPKTFAKNVISGLGSVIEQTVVKSKDMGFDTHSIEDFHNACFDAANEMLRKRRHQYLNVFADAQFALRGRTARVVLFRLKDGILIPDIRCWDGRYMQYDVDEKGVSIAGYKMKRSKGQIESEYGIVIKDNYGDVYDIYSHDHNELWINNKRVSRNKDGSSRVEEHYYSQCPVVVEVVASGYGDIFLDEDHYKYEGESIYSDVRDLYSELNRVVSIMQTLNLKSVKGPMNYEHPQGKAVPEYEDATDMGTITEGKTTPVNYGDIKKASEMAYNIIEKYLREGSITSIDLGNLEFPLSAVALVELGEGRDRVFLPILDSKAKINQATTQMFTKQILDMHVSSVEIQNDLYSEKLSTKNLDGKYTTMYKYYAKSPKTDIARMNIAQLAERYYDPQTILAEVLQVEDPADILRKRYLYQAEIDFPIIKQHREILAALELAKRGDKNAAVEAKMMAMQLGVTIDQIKKGILPVTPQNPGQESVNKQLMSSMEGNGETGNAGAKGMPPAKVAQQMQVKL